MGRTLIPAVTLMIIVLARAATAGGQEANAYAADSTPFTALGTWNGMSVMTTLIRQYEDNQKAHFINYTPLVGLQIPGCLSRHECDVGMTLESLLPEPIKKEAAHFDSRPAGRFVVGVIVNAKSPVRSISLDDLKKVFTGKTIYWKDVGESSNSGRIEPFRPLAISTQGMLFQGKVLLDCWYVDPPWARIGRAARRKEYRCEGWAA